MEKKMTKFTYEIVMNVGSYQSIRIGGEWSVTDTPTTEQVVSIDSDLRQKVAEVVESRKAVPAPQLQPEEDKREPQLQPEEDKRELVTTSKKDEARLKAILKKIQAGTPEETVRKYFRFDDKAEMLVKIALQDIMHS